MFLKYNSNWIYPIKISIILLALTMFYANKSNAQEHNQDSTKNEKKFASGEFIIDHISDAYEWHILTIGHTHVSIPLPVIIYSKNKGLKIFMSSKFHHGKEEYEGFLIAKEGAHKGKIVEKINESTFERPIDISITKNVLQLFIVVAVVLFVFISISRRYQKNPGKAPHGIQSLIEPLILFIRDDIAKSSIGHKKYEKYLPYLLSIFFFIFFGNLIGLVPIFPGGANLTGNIAITMVLAVFTFIITTISANKNYWQHIVNAPGVPWWLKIPIPLMPVVELIGVFTKPFVLMVRLFANITAGHIIALGFFSLIFIFGNMNPFAGYGISVLSVAFTIFMTMLELLVAFIQAYVFTLLSALYFGMAIEEHHHEKH